MTAAGEYGFHVLTVGWDLDVIGRLADPVERGTGFTFSHILAPSVDRVECAEHAHRRVFFIRDDLRQPMPEPDTELLTALEQPDIPTIHNMIMGDRSVRSLDYTHALAYASYLARRLEELFRQINPSIVIGGFDGLHSGLALAVARKLSIPWFALNFTAIPLGMVGFCTGMTPSTAFSLRPPAAGALRMLAERTLDDFETRRLVVPAYLSANSLGVVLKRLPAHVRLFLRGVRRVLASRFDPFTQTRPAQMVRTYVRKRLNLVLLSRQAFVHAPPSTPFLFFGLHLQPESSIDVWAPFLSDQFAVIDAISRSTPPSHQLLVKLHKSDADHYSYWQLNRLRRLPGVQLVSPYAESRDFIAKASLVLAIQGNIAMEAALLGRPVLLFGDSHFTRMPSVSQVRRMTDLPAQVRSKLAEEPSDREAIIRGLTSYLSFYGLGCSNDWRRDPSAAEVQALAEQFKALREWVLKQTPPRSSHEGVAAVK